MKKYINILIIIIISILLTFCKKKEITELINITNLDIEFTEKNKGCDTLYLINKVIVLSTNDSVIDYAKIKIIDENENIIIDDYWKNLNYCSFGLPERRKYTLRVILYKDIEIIDTIEKIIDNNKYPDYIQIINISSNINLSNLPNLDNNYKNIVIVQGVEDDISPTYLYKFYTEDATSYTIPDLYIPITQYKETNKDIDWEDWWAIYIISVNYARGEGNNLWGYYINKNEMYIKDIIESGNIQANIMYQYKATDDFIITYKCIYEN